jgi:uncharacterized SAM-binding protein YcdF (DUF218 family)
MKRWILCAGFVALAAAFRLVFIAGGINNTIYMLGISGGLLGYGFYFEKLKKIRWLNIALALAGLAGVGLVIFIAAYGARPNVSYREDVVLVLGAGIRNGRVSRTLQMRLDTALAYHRMNPGALIIVSGGQGRGEEITEALAMKRYLTANGVPDYLIFEEGESVSTFTNMQFSKIILDRLFDGQPEVVVVTNNFHIFRSVQFAQAMGMQSSKLPAPTPWHTLPVNYAREVAAVVKMWVTGR